MTEHQINKVVGIITENTLDEWKEMSYDYFCDNVVSPLNNLNSSKKTKKVFDDIILNLERPQFDLLVKKCWEEQDKQPQNYENATDNELIDCYDETLPIVILLENILTIRFQVEKDKHTRTEMAKQLALLNVILSTHVFDDLADELNSGADE